MVFFVRLVCSRLKIRSLLSNVVRFLEIVRQTLSKFFFGKASFVYRNKTDSMSLIQNMNTLYFLKAFFAY